MKVLINGQGNIGTTLTLLLLKYKDLLQIEKVYVNKNTIIPWDLDTLETLEKKGALLCSSLPKHHDPDSVFKTVDYIFDCTSNGMGLANKKRYKKLSNLKGCSAQGSEKGFGPSFMNSMPKKTIQGQKFVHIVSCNTHAAASLLTSFAGENLENLDSCDFVVVRRSEDIGNHQRLVGANVVARHLNAITGTHHGIDVKDLFGQRSIPIQIQSSDITTPSQLMHSTRFTINFKEPLFEFENKIKANIFASTTKKFDSNAVFEMGRRFGFAGRMFEHFILVKNNLLFGDNFVKGWAFVPQEGNTLLSTIEAFLIQTNQKKVNKKIEKMASELIHPAY